MLWTTSVLTPKIMALEITVRSLSLKKSHLKSLPEQVEDLPRAEENLIGVNNHGDYSFYTYIGGHITTSNICIPSSRCQAGYTQSNTGFPAG